MLCYFDKERETFLKKEIKRISDNSKRIKNLLTRDDLRADLLKVKDLRMFFKKGKLPKLITQQHILNEKRQSDLNSKKNILTNKNKGNKTLYTNKTTSIINGGWFNFSTKVEKIQKINPKLFDLKKENFKSLPHFYKKMKPGYQINRDEKIEDEELIEKYKQNTKENDCDLKNLIIKPDKIEQNFSEENQKNKYIDDNNMTQRDYCKFNAQEYHLKTSLVIQNNLKKFKYNKNSYKKGDILKVMDTCGGNNTVYSVIDL